LRKNVGGGPRKFFRNHREGSKEEKRNIKTIAGKKVFVLK